MGGERMDKAEFETRISRVRVVAFSEDGKPGVRIQVRPLKPQDEDDHGVVQVLTCGSDGLPRLADDNRLDCHPTGVVASREDESLRLVAFLTGRCAWWQATNDLRDVSDADTVAACERIGMNIRMAVSDVGFPWVFRDALLALSGWRSGSWADLIDLFEMSGGHVRAFVRDNPFLSEIAYHRIAPTPLSQDPRSAPLGEVPPHLQIRLRRAPWSDHAVMWDLSRMLDLDEGAFPDEYLDALMLLGPDSLPETRKALVAFVQMMELVDARGNDGEPPPDLRSLVRGLDGDWVGLAEDYQAAFSQQWGPLPYPAYLKARLSRLSHSFAALVLLPARAHLGTLEGYRGGPPPEELATVAHGLLFGGLNLRQLLPVIRAGDRLPASIPAGTMAHATDDAWAPLFPTSRRDGFILHCLTTPAEVSAAGYPGMGGNRPSMRALAKAGWVHLVAVDAFTETGGRRRVAVAAVHWSRDGWKTIERGPGVEGGLAEHREEAAMAALQAHLDAFPAQRRPRYEPIPPGEAVRDACGYDWRDIGNVRSVLALFRTVLPEGLHDLGNLTQALIRADGLRPVPSLPDSSHLG